SNVKLGVYRWLHVEPRCRSFAAGVVAVASQLGLLPFLLADFAAVLAPLSALRNLAAAGGMRAFLGVGHLTPQKTGAILLTSSCRGSGSVVDINDYRNMSYSRACCASSCATCYLSTPWLRAIELRRSTTSMAT